MRPILANDPHLPFALPAPWYLARIVSPEGTLAVPPLPAFRRLILGHNDAIAWGLTSSDIDVEDVFVERLDPREFRAVPRPWWVRGRSSREEGSRCVARIPGYCRSASPGMAR